MHNPCPRCHRGHPAALRCCTMRPPSLALSCGMCRTQLPCAPPRVPKPCLLPAGYGGIWTFVACHGAPCDDGTPCTSGPATCLDIWGVLEHP
jgi:hypothetical protein